MANYFEELRSASLALENDRNLSITSDMLLRCVINGGKIITMGNGGSATEAMHLTEELVGRFKKERQPIASICLNSDVGVLTCIANDFGYEKVFSRQIQALAKPEDVVVIFTTSGNSQNLFYAMEECEIIKCQTILLTGKSLGICSELAHNFISIKSEQSSTVQELHVLVLHEWLRHLENNIIKNQEDRKQKLKKYTEETKRLLND